MLTEIGGKYNKTAAQTALRFLIQNGVVVIPKSTRKERMVENFNVFDFALTQGDMDKISELDTDESLFFSHQDPQTVEWFIERSL
ncbi:MAG: aldo/keto reductase [Lachnospiraceae bacterium]